MPLSSKIMIPPLDSMWRLTEDWHVPYSVASRWDNRETIFSNWNIDINAQQWPEWEARRGSDPYGAWSKQDAADYHLWQESVLRDANVVFPKGTILVFDRYHASHSGDHAITLRVLTSPEPRLRNKKQGGIGKGKMRLYLRIEELNSFPEVEQYHG